MRVFTPDEVATGTESKYLGDLVAAKYSRELNTLPSEPMPMGEDFFPSNVGAQSKRELRGA